MAEHLSDMNFFFFLTKIKLSMLPTNLIQKYIACLRRMDAETKGSIKYPQIH